MVMINSIPCFKMDGLRSFKYEFPTLKRSGKLLVSDIGWYEIYLMESKTASLNVKSEKKLLPKGSF